MDYSGLALPILEARVDWISGSAHAGEKAAMLRSFVQGQIAGEVEAGDKETTWRFHGYAGKKAGSWRYGSGTAGTIVAVSGRSAHLERCSLAQLSDQWSRVDYAVTVQDPSDAWKCAFHLWKDLTDEAKHAKKAFKFAHVENSERGETVYLGSRTSARFGRVYNKTAESGNAYPAGSWRWEIEAKEESAKSERTRWERDDLGGRYIVDMVSAGFRRWGVGVPWRATTNPQWETVGKPMRETQRLLNWLTTQVQPSVQWLVERVGERRVFEALGLEQRFDDEEQTG